jgi:DNA-binding PadR family transcriptional regulator
MYNRSGSPWTAEFEAVRRQRGRGRSHGRHPFGPGWSGPAGGPPPWVAQMFGPQWAGHGGSRGGRTRSRVRRGDVRAAILDVLANTPEPLNGYQVIQQIAERTDGAWKPSPGSVYPTIAQLEEEGLLDGDDERGRRTVSLSATGRAFLDQHADEVDEVWAPFTRERAERPSRDGEAGPDFATLKPELGRVMNAVWQIITTGTDDQRRAGVGVLVEARRALYQILADHPGDEVDHLDDRHDGEEER